MKLLQYRQENEVQSEVEALAAVISPILKGILLSLNREIVMRADMIKYHCGN